MPAINIKRGGKVTTSNTMDWQSLDLHLDVGTRIEQMVHSESLLVAKMNDKTKRFEVTPWLASAWEQPDTKTIIFKLQKGVVFHDGSPFNAETVKWNLLRMRDHAKSANKDHTKNIASIDVVDESTIKLNLKAPSAAALWLLSASANSRPMMQSKAALDKNGEEYMASHYVSTGPFELVEWKKGDRQTFKRFEKYWQQGVDGKPKPYLDSVEVRWIQDSAVAMVELRTGNLQILPDVQPRDLAVVRSNPDLVLQKWPWEGTIRMIGLNPKGGPFQDNLKLRQAAQQAVDRESMAKTLGLGAGSAPKSVIAEGQVGYSESIPKYEFDLAKSQQLVKDAGYPNGVDVSLTVISRNPDLPQAEVLKSMWDKAGLRTTIDAIERIAWAGKIQAYNFHATTYSTGFEVDPSLTMSRRMGCEGNANWAMWCNKQFDACLAESDAAPNDEKRGETLRRCLQIAHDEAHFVNMWVLDNHEGYNKKLKGQTPFYRVWNFWPDLYLE
jgi:peptide/nickel transport system substrate-binding protein